MAALAAAEPEAIEFHCTSLRPWKSKARDISACMRILHEQYHDKVPEDFNALLKLPGVGRKKRKPDHGDVFGKPAIVTDTSLYPPFQPHRPSVHDMKDPEKVEMALWKIIPPKKAMISATVLSIMEEVCTARTKPYCDPLLSQ